MNDIEWSIELKENHGDLTQVDGKLFLVINARKDGLHREVVSCADKVINFDDIINEHILPSVYSLWKDFIGREESDKEYLEKIAISDFLKEDLFDLYNKMST